MSPARPRCRTWFVPERRACALLVLLLAAPAVAAPALLSAAQQQWLGRHQPRFAPEHDYGPFVFQRDDGVVDGLSVDMLRLLQQRLGLALQWLPAAPLHEQLAAAREGRADLLSSLRPTPERAAFLAFTRPYASVPALLVQRRDASRQSLDQLAGRPVAVGRGYAVEAVVRQRWPRVRWQAVSDDTVGLRGVADGRYDAAVADAASIAFITRRFGLQGLRAQRRIGFEYALSFGVRRDWPELVAILDAGIQALTPSERQAVFERWLPELAPPPAAPKAPWATRIGLGLLLLALASGTLLWWRRRREHA